VTARIAVASRREGEQIRAGLADPTVRAFVKVMGALAPLPSDRARARVLRFVADHFDEGPRTGGGDEAPR